MVFRGPVSGPYGTQHAGEIRVAVPLVEGGRLVSALGPCPSRLFLVDNGTDQLPVDRSLERECVSM